MNPMIRAPSPNRSRALEALAGTVERVTCRNAENGFCVLKVQVRGKRDPSVVVGHTPAIGAGKWIIANPAWASDRTHGFEFRADVLEAIWPPAASALGIAGRGGAMKPRRTKLRGWLGPATPTGSSTRAIVGTAGVPSGTHSVA